MKAEGVNAAYIAVTADKHLDYIRLCLNAGVPVLCEKPFTVNAGEAEQAFALAKEKGLYLCEAMWTWFNAPALTVRTWLPKIGAVKKVTAKYCVPISGNPRLVDPARLGGALVDIGVYPIRYTYELFGMPKKIVCEGSVEGGVDHKEKVTLFYDGFEAVLEIDMDEFKGEEFVIEGEKGCIRVPWFHAAQEVLLTGEEEARFEDGSPKYGTQMARAAEEIALRRRSQTGAKRARSARLRTRWTSCASSTNAGGRWGSSTRANAERAALVCRIPRGVFTAQKPI